MYGSVRCFLRSSWLNLKNNCVMNCIKHGPRSICSSCIYSSKRLSNLPHFQKPSERLVSRTSPESSCIIYNIIITRSVVTVKFYNVCKAAASISTSGETSNKSWKTDGYNWIVFRAMAGHSKWQNIKHTKATKDAMRARSINKYCRLARTAVKEGGGPNPKLNSKLAKLMDEARGHNVPLSSIESSIKKALNAKIKHGITEIVGPGGCLILVEYETDNVSKTMHDFKALCRKHSASIVKEGRRKFFFEEKGILKVAGTTDNTTLDVEKAVEAAIEAGAEDVQQRTDENENVFLEFFCHPHDLYKVKKYLESSPYVLEDSYIGQIAKMTIELSSDDIEKVADLCTQLQDMEEVNRIYENVQ